MDDVSNLSHADYDYYIKIKTADKKWRYFYSAQEYQAYLRNLRKKAERTSDGKQPEKSTSQSTGTTRKKPISITSDDPNLETTNGFLADQIADIKRRRQENLKKQRREKLEKDKDARRKAAGESLKRRDVEIQNAQKRAQESYRNEQEKARKESAAEVEKAEAEAAEIEKKRKALADRRKLPDKVSVTDYLLGGQFRKDLRSSKKNLKKIRKDLERQNREAERLDAKINALSEKMSELSGREKQKLEKLKEQRSELQSSIDANRKQQLKYVEDYTVALYRYEGATLLGQIGKKMRSRKRKATSIIEKYSNLLVSAMPTIKLKK